MFIAGAVVGGAVAFGAIGASSAVAAKSLFLVGAGPYEPSDGKLTIEIVNLSGRELEVNLESKSCGSTNSGKVPADTMREVTFELAGTCKVDASTSVAAVVAAAAAGETHEIEITLTAKRDSDTDLAPLRGFVIGLGAALVLAVGGLGIGLKEMRLWSRLNDPMPWLGKDWKFDESWAANTGLAAALFTGVFGASDVLGDLLGEGTDTKVAVVGAAIAAGLVGAAPMLLAMCKSGGQHTRGGVFLATAAVLTAHYGIILTLVLMLTGEDVAVPAWIAGIGGMVLLALYTLRTLPGVFREPPPTRAPQPTPEVRALRRIATGVEHISRSLGGELTATTETDVPPEAEQRAALI